MNKEITKYLTNLSLNKSTIRNNIEHTEDILGVKFPDDYKCFIENYNGAEGQIGSNSYIIFWSIEDVIKLNLAYNVEEFASGLILIGSDGSDIAYAIDMRCENKAIVEVPFIGMNLDEVKLCSDTFHGFLNYLYNI